MSQFAPVILFAFDRPMHLQRTLDALSSNEGAAETVLYIFCDMAKDNAGKNVLENVSSVRNIASGENRFKKVIVRLQAVNKGLAASVVEGVCEVLEMHNEVIVLEDDLYTSKWFLRYMNDALNIYRSISEVCCITGYMYPVQGLLPETFFLKGADCWGWATWKDRWTIYESDGAKLLDELKESGRINEFDFDGSYPYNEMLADQVKGRNHSWAVRWYASAFLKNRYCLYPGRSLVQNIGFDGSGVHSGVSDLWDVKVSAEPLVVKELSVKEDLKAKHLIATYFRSLKKKKNLLDKFSAKFMSIFNSNAGGRGEQ
jgi:hypothetical protein